MRIWQAGIASLLLVALVASLPGLYYYTESGSTPQLRGTSSTFNRADRVKLKTIEEVPRPPKPDPSELSSTQFELETLRGDEKVQAQKQLRVEINNASKKRLESLPKVGPVRAEGIIKYRQSHNIDTVTELTNIPGIGPKTARSVKDNILIHGSMPKGEALTSGESSRDTGPIVHLNSAGVKKLTKLDGIGSVTAKKIIQYRQSNGTIHDFNELTSINGIGRATVKKLRSHGDL